jgi:hypothetical protein
MTDSDLKLRLFREIDGLDKSKLNEIYGVLMNYINGQKDVSDWDKLSDEQKKGILDADDDIEKGKGIPNEVVFNEVRKKYPNA